MPTSDVPPSPLPSPLAPGSGDAATERTERTAPPEGIYHPSIAWLHLSDTLDDKARAIELAWQFARCLPSRPHILDLGAGTGGNLRYLLPRLGRRIQDWTLVEANPGLFDRMETETERWARAYGWGISRQSGQPLLFGDDLRCHLTMVRQDIGFDVYSLGIQRYDGVAAHRFLGWVSPEWLDHFVVELNSSGRLPLLATGLPDGVPNWQPGDPDDGLIADLVLASAGRDHGQGPPLGLTAGKTLTRVLGSAGYQVDGARSDWRLDGSRSTRRLAALIHELAMLASQIDPGLSERVLAWQERRLEQVEETSLVLARLDLLAH